MLVAGKNFTIGADPEIFISKGGHFVSAHDKIPGDKHAPYKVESGAVQVDGMALEFNIDPAESLEEFQSNLTKVQNTLKGMVGEEFEFMKETSVYFDKEFAKGIPKANLMLGCSPDYNGWTFDENPSPKSFKYMRTVGGHVHIGGFGQEDYYNWDYFTLCARISRVLDETLGVYSLFWDGDDKRRDMYGKAGSFRPKPYGMEYRTLSNAWIFDKKLTTFVYNGVKEALDIVFSSDYNPPEIVRDIIDNSDRGSGYFNKDMLTQNKVRMVA